MNRRIFWAIAALALIIRLYCIDFGLPALLDPDEPFFISTALRMLRDGSLNPHWFGHPGATTFYAIQLIAVGEYLIGHLLGYFADTRAFGAAVYASPPLLVLPLRIFFALCGTACVMMTMLIGRRVDGWQTGLIAGAILAFSGLHIEISQIVRTDIMAGLFMLIAVYASVAIVQRDQMLDVLWAAIPAGMAVVTKWPGATVLIAPVLAILWRDWHVARNWRRALQRLALLFAGAILTMVLVSPFLVIEFSTVLSNLAGEGRPDHVGANGHGFVRDFIWYVTSVLPMAVGWAAYALALFGLMVSARAKPGVVVLVVAPMLLFLVLICAHPLIWERWVVPILPFVALLAAIGAVRMIGWVRERFRAHGVRAAWVALVLLGLLPELGASVTRAHERMNDTRTIATRWAVRHLPANSVIAVEWFAFDLVQGSRAEIVFPAGDRGCVNARKELSGQINDRQVAPHRGDRPVVTLGSVAAASKPSCNSDFAMVSQYDRYRAESARYPGEIAAYAALARGGRQIAIFRPVPGKIGGPVVRIIQRAGAHWDAVAAANGR